MEKEKFKIVEVIADSTGNEKTLVLEDENGEGVSKSIAIAEWDSKKQSFTGEPVLELDWIEEYYGEPFETLENLVDSEIELYVYPNGNTGFRPRYEPQFPESLLKERIDCTISGLVFERERAIVLVDFDVEDDQGVRHVVENSAVRLNYKKGRVRVDKSRKQQVMGQLKTWAGTTDLEELEENLIGKSAVVEVDSFTADGKTYYFGEIIKVK